MAITKGDVPRSRRSHQPKFLMDASFEEKSVWIQLSSIAIGLGLYFIVAGSMLFSGVNTLFAFVPVFTLAVALIVAVNVAGHVAVAIASRPDGRDERDRLIAWRAESNSAWILGAGVIAAIACMITSIGEVWVAHLLLLTLFVAEFTRGIIQVVYYRRGM